VLSAPPSPQEYRYALAIPTRWNDNDMHGHVNNVEYYSFFDTVVTVWLVNEAGLDVRSSDVLGLCVESQCDFRAPISFPATVDAHLRVGKIGRSSVRYEIALFSDGNCAATGRFVHVYVDRTSRRPAEIPQGFRDALERVAV
jgi:acyl-CoA thioester hydrolase